MMSPRFESPELRQGLVAARARVADARRIATDAAGGLAAASERRNAARAAAVDPVDIARADDDFAKAETVNATAVGELASAELALKAFGDPSVRATDHVHKRSKLDAVEATDVFLEADDQAEILASCVAAITSLAEAARLLANARDRQEARDREKFRLRQAMGEVDARDRFERCLEHFDNARAEALGIAVGAVCTLERNGAASKVEVVRLLEALTKSMSASPTEEQILVASMLLAEIVAPADATASA